MAGEGYSCKDATVFAACYLVATTVSAPALAEHSGLLISTDETHPPTLRTLLSQERRILAARSVLESCLQNKFRATKAHISREEGGTALSVTIHNTLPFAVTGWHFDLASDWLGPEDQGPQYIEWPFQTPLRSMTTQTIQIIGSPLASNAPDRFPVGISVKDIIHDTRGDLIQPVFDWLPLRVSSIAAFEDLYYLLCTNS